jgi:uncharacterized protein YuzE
MQIKVDTQADGLYITFKQEKIAKAENKEDYLMDYDENGDLIGFEVLDFASKIKKF